MMDEELPFVELIVEKLKPKQRKKPRINNYVSRLASRAEINEVYIEYLFTRRMLSISYRKYANNLLIVLMTKIKNLNESPISVELFDEFMTWYRHNFDVPLCKKWIRFI
jgi:hypothetical protein